MPAYNAGRYLRPAVDSILAQDFLDFEFIVVDDGSTDETGPVFDEYARRDPRVRVFHRSHSGVCSAREFAISVARGRYVALADADDVYLPIRLRRQFELLEACPEVGVCGAWAGFVDSRGWRCGRSGARLVDDAAIRSELLFRSGIANPVAMLRRRILDDEPFAYDPSYPYGGDYEMWARLSRRTRFANVPEVLFLYRRHGRQISQRHGASQVDAAARVRARLLRETLHFEPTPAELTFHERLCHLDLPRTREALMQAHRWLTQLADRNQRERAYPAPAFARTLDEYWLRVCIKCAAPGVGAWSTFWRSRFTHDFTPPWEGRRALALRASGLWPLPGLRYLRQRLRRAGRRQLESRAQ